MYEKLLEIEKLIKRLTNFRENEVPLYHESAFVNLRTAILKAESCGDPNLLKAIARLPVADFLKPIIRSEIARIFEDTGELTDNRARIA